MAEERYAPWRDVWRLPLRAVRLTFSGGGRSRRLELIYFYAASNLASFVLITLFFPTKTGADGHLSENSLQWLADVVLLIPLPALLVRRFHDQGRSGWWSLFVLLLGAAAGLSQGVLGGMGTPPLWLMLSNGLVVAIVLFLVFQPGTDGANRFGVDPRPEGAE